ncbi:MAG TPA: DUF4255 domain-containing protein [Cytophagaceae bacterium]|jgi:hypothetical protein|nr:DUF4255 domain-containing protein [Cytophagaceae bacterium]
MIAKALSFISNYINKEIKLTFGLSDDMVIASSLINPDGSVTESLENKIIISIINLEHETATKQIGNMFNGGDNQYGKTAPPVFLNLYVLISANYTSSNYLEALKMLSAVIAIVQANPSFSRSNFPDMDVSADKLNFEIYNIPINELSHIWSGIGAKYVPSIIYKVRMISIQKNLIQEELSGITGIQKGNTSVK